MVFVPGLGGGQIWAPQKWTFCKKSPKVGKNPGPRGKRGGGKKKKKKKKPAENRIFFGFGWGGKLKKTRGGGGALPPGGMGPKIGGPGGVWGPFFPRNSGAGGKKNLGPT